MRYILTLILILTLAVPAFAGVGFNLTGVGKILSYDGSLPTTGGANPAVLIDFLQAGVTDPNTGLPASGGFAYFYAPGTTTAKDVYTSSAMGTVATNPAVLNAAGVATVYGYGNYKIVVTNSSGTRIVTYDGVSYYNPSKIDGEFDVLDTIDVTLLTRFATSQSTHSLSAIYAMDSDDLSVKPIKIGSGLTTSNGLYVTNSGTRVGVNLAAPTVALDVNGDIKSSGAFTVASISAASLSTSGAISAGTTLGAGGAISGASLNVGAGAIAGGAITGSSLNIGSGTVTAGAGSFSGALSGANLSTGSGAITGGAITGTSLSAGSGSISGGAISGTTGLFTGLLSANGGIAVDTDKFTVADSTGNVATQGTIWLSRPGASGNGIFSYRGGTPVSKGWNIDFSHTATSNEVRLQSSSSGITSEQAMFNSTGGLTLLTGFAQFDAAGATGSKLYVGGKAMVDGKLHVAQETGIGGAPVATRMLEVTSAAGTDSLLVLKDAADEVAYVNQHGNMTLGAGDMASTNYRMLISGAITRLLALQLPMSTLTWGAYLDFEGFNSASVAKRYASIKGEISDNTAGSVDGALKLYTASADALTAGFVMNDSQAVTIGATDLAGAVYKFYVNGNSRTATQYVNNKVESVGSTLNLVNGVDQVYVTMRSSVQDETFDIYDMSGVLNLVYRDSWSPYNPRDLKIGDNTANEGLYWDTSELSLGINDDTPSHTLDVNGRIGVNTLVLRNPPNATATMLGWNSVSSEVCLLVSSKRFKRDIESLILDWDTFNRIRPVTYRMKNEKDGPKLEGIIAEELNEVYPGTVILDKAGLPLSIDYGRLVSPTIKAVQELKLDADERDAKIKELEAQIVRLEDRLFRIEAALEKGVK